MIFVEVSLQAFFSALLLGKLLSLTTEQIFLLMGLLCILLGSSPKVRLTLRNLARKVIEGFAKAISFVFYHTVVMGFSLWLRLKRNQSYHRRLGAWKSASESKLDLSRTF